MAAVITEVKTRLDGSVQHFECEQIVLDNDYAQVKYVLPESIYLHGIFLPQFTISFGHFWRDKPWNLYHFFNPQCEELAGYFNICDHTEISIDTIGWRDLVIDIVCAPGRPLQIVDANELPQTIDPQLKRYIETAVTNLSRQAQTILAASRTGARQQLKC